ncbi:retrovirus-related pol polyprotein from transposon TNT 1-94 [Tanacetum coccineum]
MEVTKHLRWVMSCRRTESKLFYTNQKQPDKFIKPSQQVNCIAGKSEWNGLIIVPGIANQNVNQTGNGNVVATRAGVNGNGNNQNQIRCYNCRGLDHYARSCTVRLRRRDVAYLQTQLLIAQKEKAEI